MQDLLIENVLTESHVQEYTVSSLSQYIKRIIENDIGYVRVKGEISGLKIATSGHAYFSLKDEAAVLACTCWRPSLSRLKVKPEEGMQIVAYGKLTTYPGNSRYQLTVESMEADGVGALMQLLEKRKKQFQEEGLFDHSRKKKLPFFPKTIGVVTSITGAVIRDIMHRIEDRCPAHVIIWPVTVQGETAAGEISAAINGFNQFIKPDVIIVARGGGSIEDLWAFNEEIVVRSAASSHIPIISAVGHETDFTLIDFVADVRAPTPTAAAEMAVPVFNDLKFSLEEVAFGLNRSINNYLIHTRNLLEVRASRVPTPTDTIRFYEQKLDDLSERLQYAIPRQISHKEQMLGRINIEHINPRKHIEQRQKDLDNLWQTVRLHTRQIYIEKLKRLEAASSLLSSLDYKKVLGRGYALVRDKNGSVISSAKTPLQEFSIEFSDGLMKVDNLTKS